MTTPDLSLVRQMDNAQEGYVPVRAGALAIDVERARAVLHGLKEVADEVAAMSRDLIPGFVAAPAIDEVSQNAARQAVKMLAASRAYLASWYGDLAAGIEALEQQIADYTAADQQSSRL